MSGLKNIKIGKVVLNIGAGKDAGRLEKGLKLLKMISGKDAVKTITQKRIAGWGLRPGLPVGCKVTVRGDDAVELVKQLLGGVDRLLSKNHFDSNGNISFGIPEYIDIPGLNYDPEIGVIGLQVSITLERPGFRVARRKLKKSRIGESHRISKVDAIAFMKDNFGVKLKEEEQ